MSAATDKGVLAVMLEAAWPLAEAGEFLLPKRLLAARDVVAELIQAGRLAVEDDGGTKYYGDEDEIGERVCCGAASYKPHEADCWVTAIRAALARIGGAQ